MKKENLFFIGVALVVGILLGVIFTKGGSDAPQQQSRPPQAAAPPVVNFEQKIKMLQGVVASEPANRNAWVQLGNTYFDSNQFMPAVEAYDKALELDGNDPNVLTDQGVMFRKLGWFDRAIDNFEKANSIAPNHQQSLYNLGIVYRYDLQNFKKAEEAWSRFLELSPSGPGSDQIRAELEFLRAHPAQPGAK